MPHSTPGCRRCSLLHGEVFSRVPISTGTISRPRVTFSVSCFPNQQTLLDTEPARGAGLAAPDYSEPAAGSRPRAQVLLRLSPLATSSGLWSKATMLKQASAEHHCRRWRAPRTELHPIRHPDPDLQLPRIKHWQRLYRLYRQLPGLAPLCGHAANTTGGRAACGRGPGSPLHRGRTGSC